MKIGKSIISFFKYFLTLILALVILLCGLIFMFERGPSKSIRDLFVLTVTQSSAAKFTAHMFLDDETINQIINDNTISSEVEVGNTDLITGDATLDLSLITIEDIVGPNFKGKMMIVNDPSRVYVYSIPEYGVPRGKQVLTICKEENAMGGINGGGFEDIGGQGKGGTPVGIVMSNGKYLYGSKTAKHQVIGLNNDNKLIVGTMTGQEAIDAGIRDAVEWGPALIINGEALDVGDAGSANPRTAIGQRADGAILMLVIDGRQGEYSWGASYSDLQEILLRYGAVNAGNLDGGLSSSMVYDNEIITHPYSLYGTGERPLPTAILVRR